MSASSNDGAVLCLGLDNLRRVKPNMLWNFFWSLYSLVPFSLASWAKIWKGGRDMGRLQCQGEDRREAGQMWVHGQPPQL